MKTDAGLAAQAFHLALARRRRGWTIGLRELLAGGAAAEANRLAQDGAPGSGCADDHDSGCAWCALGICLCDGCAALARGDEDAVCGLTDDVAPPRYEPLRGR